ncbi:MAG: DNA-binding response OmpR family regulator [Phycisphaerales bacterium]|jgi:DNA-binding response OmpR family regulator
MQNVRFHPGPDSPANGGGDGGGGLGGGAECSGGASGGRLNLLLSYAGWQQDPWVERLPRMLEPMGVRSLQAGSGREASRFIEHEPIHIAVVDLALPFDDSPQAGGLMEAGPRLLDVLGRLRCPPPTVVVKRSKTLRDDQRELSASLKAGAFAVIDRPHTTGDLESLLDVLRRILKRHYAGRWPGMG